MDNEYYMKVGDYYNEDAGDFDERYWSNKVLQTIRQSFREEVKKRSFVNMLEIGYGTGLDMIHFGKTHPGANIAGIDISSEMHSICSSKIAEGELQNVRAECGSVEHIEDLFPDEKFDMICVFFGALNTVEDLNKTAATLNRILSKNGEMVLTFVNKYYLAGSAIELMKLRIKPAFARFKKVWGGYSPVKHLPSKCYSPREIKRIFRDFNLVKKRGYSILYPAWYYPRMATIPGKSLRFLWKADQLLNKTFFWKFGEYTLFVFKKG